MKIFHRKDRRERRGNLKDFLGSFSLRALRLCGRNLSKSSFSHPPLLLILVTIFGSFTTATVRAETVDSSIQAGIADYRQQNFDQAEINFSKAHEEQPENPKLNYNLANSHYKKGQYEKALESYGQATVQKASPDLQQKSLYNSGNALYRMGKLEESIAAYKNVLEMNPKDMDAKFNLEFVREKLKEKNQQNQKQDQQQDGDSEDNKNPKQNPSPDENSDTEDDRQNSAQQENLKPSENPEQRTDPSSSKQKESKPSEVAENHDNAISKHQAEQWLSGLDEDLKKFSQKQARKEKGQAPVSNRDW